LAETYAVTHEQPPVTPVRAEGEVQNSPVSKKALEGFQKLARGTTNTYTAYGATEFLYQECARQAHYTIPQASRDDEEMPKTEDGEDLGIGEGWWVSGILAPVLLM
jgi:cytochrome b pre-mRNA-processing protein 3